MPVPSLVDDGRTVTIDLHGVPVEQAILMFERTLRLATQRGRSTVKAIHGSSTTSSADDRTIRNELRRYLDDSRLTIVGQTYFDDFLIVGLPLTKQIRTDRIRLTDVI